MTTEPCSDLLDIGAVAELLDVTQASARTIISRSAKTNWPFPEPCIRLGGSPGWEPCSVHEWISGRPGAGRGPRPNRRLSDQQRIVSLANGRTYLTAGQMSKILGITIDELSRRRSNAPKQIKAGGFIRYEISAILEWLATRESAKIDA